MFGGSWSTGSVSTAPTSSGGGWGTGSLTSGGWSTGSAAPATSPSSGGTWSFDSGVSSSGGGGTYAYAVPVYGGSYSYQGSGGYYALPGAGLYAALPGEGGAYTPIDFPLMHELRPGERLDNMNVRGMFRENGTLPYLALGVIAALLLK